MSKDRDDTAADWRRWTAYALPAWAALVLLLSAQRHAFGIVNDQPTTLIDSLHWYGFQFGPWLALSPLLFWILCRHDLQRSLLRIHVPWLIAGALLMVVLHTALQSALKINFYSDFVQLGFAAAFSYLILAKGHVELSVYLAVAGLVYVVRFWHRQQRYAEQRAQRERLIAVQRLHQFRRQLAPHFLFNALNSLSALLNEGSPEMEMVLAIGVFLRRVIDFQQTTTSLSAEIETVRAYLAIEKLRYGDRLSVRWELDPNCAQLQLPHLLFQPLVENAVVHGAARMNGTAEIIIRTRRQQRVLRVEVRNQCPKAPAVTKTGQGQRMLKALLRSSYGDQASLESSQPAPGWFVATLTIPATQEAS